MGIGTPQMVVNKSLAKRFTRGFRPPLEFDQNGSMQNESTLLCLFFIFISADKSQELNWNCFRGHFDVLLLFCYFAPDFRFFDEKSSSSWEVSLKGRIYAAVGRGGIFKSF